MTGGARIRPRRSSVTAPMRQDAVPAKAPEHRALLFQVEVAGVLPV